MLKEIGLRVASATICGLMYNLPLLYFCCKQPHKSLWHSLHDYLIYEEHFIVALSKYQKNHTVRQEFKLLSIIGIVACSVIVSVWNIALMFNNRMIKF